MEGLTCLCFNNIARATTPHTICHFAHNKNWDATESALDVAVVHDKMDKADSAHVDLTAEETLTQSEIMNDIFTQDNNVGALAISSLQRKFVLELMGEPGEPSQLYAYYFAIHNIAFEEFNLNLMLHGQKQNLSKAPWPKIQNAWNVFVIWTLTNVIGINN